MADSNQKRIKSAKSSNLDSAIKIWIDLCIQNNIQTTDLIIKAKAIKDAESSNVGEFKTSNGWFKKN